MAFSANPKSAHEGLVLLVDSADHTSFPQLREVEVMVVGGGGGGGMDMGKAAEAEAFSTSLITKLLLEQKLQSLSEQEVGEHQLDQEDTEEMEQAHNLAVTNSQSQQQTEEIQLLEH